jgi:hypothetical protein
MPRVVKIEKKPLKNNNAWMIVSPQRGLRLRLIVGVFFSTFFSISSAMKLILPKSLFTANYLPSPIGEGRYRLLIYSW